ncbi:MAG TPA: phage portal protein [Chthonomonadaceae bacterium]|nr:phage portal protein [Chthonomonadaceae bacterium]
MANRFLRTLARGSVGLKGLSALPMGNYIGGGSRYGTGRPFFFGLLPGAKVDWQRIAGDKWKNAIVAASLAWIGRNLPQAPPCVYRRNEKGDEVIDPEHPLTQLLKSPNKFYDGRTLRQATFLSLIAGQGNAYWWVKRNNAGLPLELWYLPHYDVWPLWNKDCTTDNWILGYVYRSNGVLYQLSNEEVIHFRDGLDPENMRSGLDPLKAVSREIATDNEAAGATAALVKNCGIVPAVISPRDGVSTFNPAVADELKTMFEEQSQGDNRGRVAALSGAVDVQKLALTPAEMFFDAIQDRPEARICALIGVPPEVLGLSAGLAHSTYNNKTQAQRDAWLNGIIPRLELIHSELDTQLLCFYPEALRARCRVGADYRKVHALEQNLNELFEAVGNAVGGPYLTVNEGRALAGYAKLPDYDIVYPPGKKERESL